MLATLFLLLASEPMLGAGGIVLDAGVVLPMDARRAIHNGRVLVSSGEIQAVGTQSELAAPDGWEHYSYPDGFLFPGSVDPHSHAHTGGWGDINDMVHPVNAELRVLDTVVAWNPLYQDAAAAGVTTVNAIPGSGSNISGAGVLLKLKPGATTAETVFRQPGSVKVAQGYNPERGADLGASRMGMWWMLRYFLSEARRIAADDSIEDHPDLAHIAMIEQGHHPYLVHTAGCRDTYGTWRMFGLEAGLPVVVSHATFNGYAVAPVFADHGDVPLNLGPRNFDFSYNQKARFQGIVEAYESSGCENLSVQTDAPVVPLEELPFQAALAERLGASTWTCLESLNVKPASQMLAGDHFGRIEPGLDADLVIKAGQPLDPSTPVLLVLVDGEVVYDIRNGQRY